MASPPRNRYFRPAPLNNGARIRKQVSPKRTGIGSGMLTEIMPFDFETLVRAYSAELYRYAYWLARDRFVAEDLVQETFLRAWKSRGSLKETAAARAWLYTILRRERARLWDRKSAHLEGSLDPEAEAALEDPGLLSAIEGLEVRQAIAALPESYREPLLLQVLGGFDCKEIAAMLGTTEGAIMTRVSRARMAFRKLPGWNEKSKVA
jgi:RNA polymerase sigma-70 factor (ECF subfamily)